MHFIDLGASLDDWGYPADSNAHNPQYASVNYKLPDIMPTVDTVFIDGRYRVACALHVLQHITPKSHIVIFDDYTNRPHYASVEAFYDIIDSDPLSSTVVMRKKVGAPLVNEATIRAAEMDPR
jgi:hypothetical protein